MAGAAAGAAFRNELNIGLAGLLAGVVPDDLSGLDDRQVEALAVAFERGQAQLDASRARVHAELDTRATTDRDHGSRTPNWLALALNTPVRDAQRRVRVARRLRDEFPQLAAALAAGEVSWFHVDEFCRHAPARIAADMARHAGDLLDAARYLSFSDWRREVARTARRIEADRGDEPSPARDETANRLNLSKNADNTYVLGGTFVDAWGASIAEILEIETDRQYRLRRDLHDRTGGEEPIPTRTVLRAMALHELLRHGIATEPRSTKAPGTDLTVVLHLDPPDPTDPFGTHPHDDYQTIFGHTLTPQAMGCRLCDPLIHLMTMRDTIPLDLGRTQRYATREQRRAARARDGGCVFPGCDAPHNWCDLHHIDEWHRGGNSDIAHLVSLCRFHHGVTHRTGWTLTANPDGTFQWTTPLGATLRSQHHQQQRKHSTP